MARKVILAVLLSLGISVPVHASEINPALLMESVPIEESNEFYYKGTAYKIQDSVVFDGYVIDRVLYDYDSMTDTQKRLAESAQRSYQKTLQVPIWTIDDTSSILKITVHKSVAQNISRVFNELYDIRFPINPKETGAYSARSDRHDYTHMNHPNGLAVDINWNDNPMTSNYSQWERSSSPYKITPEVVSIFKRYGWYWGGDWRGAKDYMHFSINDK